MTGRAMRALLALAVFGFLSSVEATVSRQALGADDACDTEAGAACAVSALQLGTVRTPTDGAASTLASGGGDDPNWVWSNEVADRQQRSDRYRDKYYYMDLYNTFAPKMVVHCLEWTAYFFPMLSFWSQEVLRRVEAVPADADEATKTKLQAFSQNASFLLCDFWFDPRQGTNWSQPVAEYMQKVKSAPSTDLDMPKLEGWFARTEAMRDLWASDSCYFWATSLMCDNGVMTRNLQGSKDHGDGICWDKVKAPEYGFTVFGASLQHDRKGAPESTDIYKHDEYLECMEKPMTQELLENHCPMFGHYQSGFLNVTDWGHGFPAGSSEYNQVLQCEAKLGIPELVGTTSELVWRPWLNMTLMDPPADEQAVAFVPDDEAANAIMANVFEILDERDAWQKQQRQAKRAAEAAEAQAGR